MAKKLTKTIADEQKLSFATLAGVQGAKHIIPFTFSEKMRGSQVIYTCISVIFL